MDAFEIARREPRMAGRERIAEALTAKGISEALPF